MMIIMTDMSQSNRVCTPQHLGTSQSLSHTIPILCPQRMLNLYLQSLVCLVAKLGLLDS